MINEINKNSNYKVPLMLVTNYGNLMNIAIKIGAVLVYVKDKLKVTRQEILLLLA